MADFTRLGAPQEYIGLSTDTKPGPTVATGATLAEALDDSETGVDVSNGALFTVGQTYICESEQFSVRAISGNTLTVIRAVGGTSAAAHLNGTAISQTQVIAYGSRCYETDTGAWYVTADGGATWNVDRRDIDG